jgi:hypothetical protein
MSRDENIVVKECIEVLELFGFYAFRNNNIHAPGRTFNGKKGSSDILAISPEGLFCAVECKKNDGKPSKGQIDFVVEIERRGGYGVIVKTSEELIRYLKERKSVLNKS